MTQHWGCSYSLHSKLMVTCMMMILCSSLLASPLHHVDDEADSDDEMMMRDEIVKMAGYGEEKLSTVLITGTLLCTSCSPLPLSGALVGATCHTDTKDKRSTWVRTVTDEYGEFIIDLPSYLHAIPNLDKACSVRVFSLPKNSPCRRFAFASKPKGIQLSSVGNGIRTYTTGEIMLSNTRSKHDSKACMKSLEGEQDMSW